MENYRLNGVTNHLFSFIDNLSKWYMNLNKSRFKDCSATTPLDVLGNCLLYFSIISAPFAPFMAESIYQFTKSFCDQNIDLKESVHLHPIPQESVWKSDGNLLNLFDSFSDIVDMCRVVRTQRSNPSVKLAFPKVTIVHSNKKVLNDVKLIEDYLKDEMNIISIDYSTDEGKYVTYKAELNMNKFKQRGINDKRDKVDRKLIGKIISHVRNLDQATCKNIYEEKSSTFIAIPPLGKKS